MGKLRRGGAVARVKLHSSVALVATMRDPVEVSDARKAPTPPRASIPQVGPASGPQSGSAPRSTATSSARGSGAQSPRPPSAAHTPLAPRARLRTEPGLAPDGESSDVDGSWEGTSIPLEETRPVPPVKATIPIGAMPVSSSTSTPSSASGGTKDEVVSIVKAAVEEAVAPHVARQRELEARLERLELEARRHPSSAKTQAVVPPPVPPAAAAPAPALGGDRAELPLGEAAKTAAATVPEARSPAASQRPASLAPKAATTSYGTVVLAAPKQEVDLAALARSGSVDLDGGFDGTRRQKRVARALVVLLLLGVATMVVLTILSHN